MRYLAFAAIAAIPLSAFAVPAEATNIMPDFDGAPTGWSTDRYQPKNFSDIGTFQGRDNVLGIQIDNSDSAANRPASFASTFYNTQGMMHDAVGGAGNSIGADVFIPVEWQTANNGLRRTDMWGVLTAPALSPDAREFPIIGFTNEGTGARLRIFDGDSGGTGWVDLATSIVFGGWTALEILFTGTSYDYFVNNVLVHSDGTTNGATGFQNVIMQAYNFGEADIGNYTAHWSNSQVPEPAGIALLALGLVGMAGARQHWFRRQKA